MAVLVAGAVALAAVPAVLMMSGDDDTGTSPAPEITIPAPAAPGEPVVIEAPIAVASAAAPTAQAAVEQYLTAEIDRDLARSLSLLSDSERTAIASVEAWILRHDAMPRILGYEVTGSTGSTVTTTLELEPRLNEVQGYVPSTALATWSTVPTSDGFLVSLTATVIEPVVPADDAAAAAALAWVEGQQRCETIGQYDGNLLGEPDVLGLLCGQSGSYTAAPPGALTEFVDPGVVASAFGPEASSFARVVRMDGPIPLSVVTAPLGDRWLVVAVAS